MSIKGAYMTLKAYGWEKFFQDQIEKEELDAYIPARITAQSKGHYQVVTKDDEMKAQLSGRFLYQHSTQKEQPSVGDFVLVKGEKDFDGVRIHRLLNRKNFISRKMPISGGRKLKNDMIDGGVTEEQVMSANIDYIFIVMGLDGDFNLRRLERYLTLCINSKIQAIIILNKMDLVDNLEEYLKKIQKVAIDVPVHPISVTTFKGLEIFDHYLKPKKTVAFIGSSGVGKSTLSNYLLHEASLKVKSVSTSSGKGRHTTSHRQLYLLESGGMIIDTPGMREIQLWGTEEEVNHNFRDIEALTEGCKFNDCSHNSEPGCGIKAALEAGSLDPKRYDSYLKQLKEINNLENKRKIYDHTLSKKERLRAKIKYKN
jgi:ribosome biogenesis GTPase